MKSLLFILVAGYAVRCDDTSYYVIQMPENDPPASGYKKPFNVYWNVPTMQCKSKKIPFENLYEKYGIIQNRNDSFRGDKISILYDPGLFPALLKNESSGKFKLRNGGVPQEGDMEMHLESFRSVLDQSIPDKEFSGVGIIDFESWRPVFRQNSGVLVPYKDVSFELEKKMHWWWPKAWVQAEARQRFEKAARQFMQTTLSMAKQMRPNALWGYYGFPYCFNMVSNNMRESCADKVPEENDRTHWLWLESSALYPSVYSPQSLSAPQLSALVRGRVREAARVARGARGARGARAVLPYLWFRYRDGGYLREKDLAAALQTLYESEASGFIIWGSSNDVNTITKCSNLLNYVDSIFGPAIAKYTKPNRLHDEMNDDNKTNIDINITTTTTIKPTLGDDKLSTNINVSTTTTIKPILNGYVINNDTNIQPDPDYHWDPPINYTQDIKQYAEEEIQRKKTGSNVSLKEKYPNANMTNKENALLSFLMHLLYESTSVSNINSEEDLLVSTEFAVTTKDLVEFETSTTQTNDYHTTDENKHAIMQTVTNFQIITESQNEYNTMTTENINNGSRISDNFINMFDSYDTFNDSSTLYDAATTATTESAIDNKSTISKINRETTEYYEEETRTTTDYVESINYSDENFLEVIDSTNGGDEKDESVNAKAVNQVNVLVL